MQQHEVLFASLKRTNLEIIKRQSEFKRIDLEIIKRGPELKRTNLEVIEVS